MSEAAQDAPLLPSTASVAKWRSAGSRGYGIAVGLLMLAGLTAAKLAFSKSIGEPTPFLLYFGAVLVGAWYGRLGGGIIATGAGMLLGNYFFIPPMFHLNLGGRAVAQTLLFGIEGATITYVTARLQAARLRSAFAEVDALAAVAKMNMVLAGIDAGITVQDRTGRLLYANETAAQLLGGASVQSLLNTPVAQLVERFQLQTADGRPFSPEQLPGHAIFRGETPSEQLIRFIPKDGGEERFSLIRANPVPEDSGEVRFVVNIFRDVTEKRRQEELIRINREWFSTALRSIGDAVITTDRAGRVTFMNPVAEQLTGWLLADAMDRPLREVFVIVNETTRAAVESPVERVLRENVIVGLANHTILISRDRTEVSIDDSAAPIRSPANELVGVVLVFRNVSEKRREEKRREFLVRAAQELNSSLDYQTTLATVVRLAVPDIADWCAVDVQEDGVIKRLAVAHIDPAKIAFVSDLEQRYPSDPNAPTGVPNILRTGKPVMKRDIPLALIAAAAVDAEHLRLIRQLALRSYIGVPIMRDGKAVGAITFAMAESNRLYGPEDLQLALALADRAAIAIQNARLFSEIEQARALAAAQRDRLYELVMVSPMAIALLQGTELVYELVNQPFEQIFGGRKLQGLKAAELDPTGARLVNARRVYATGQPFTAQNQEVVFDWSGTGQRVSRYFNYTLVPMRNGSGQVEGVFSFSLEVTDQVLAQLRVEEARAQAELANRSKDEFLAMLGHELRNPLAPILTALQLMRMRAEGALEFERNIIERQVKHMVRLVDDLLDVSRITSGKIEMAQEPVEIAEVVSKAIEMASPLIEQREHEVTLDLAPELVVLGDAVRLAQILANLITNAAKYTEKGGHIWITSERSADKVRVWVRDNGIGIAPQMLPRIFDLFVQETQALDRAQGGLGLGLAIVRSLVALHGGSVTVKSDGIGQGSVFTVSLPAPPEAVRPRLTPPRLTLPAKNQGATRVLVVDDNADALELLAESLELLGYEIVRAVDGMAALAVAAKELPSIALLDIGLPLMDGYELARRLRSTRGLEGIKLVALTGYGQQSDRQRSAAAGFDAHLVKPVTMEAVQATLESLSGRIRP